MNAKTQTLAIRMHVAQTPMEALLAPATMVSGSDF